jgi:hypothetical protein
VPVSGSNQNIFSASNCRLIFMGDKQRDFGLEKYLTVGFALFEN